MKVGQWATTEIDRDESLWVERACQGDSHAWEQLVARHQEAAFRLAYLILRDADEASDAVQEGLIRAYGSLKRFDLTRPFRPWLMRIVVNVARNRRRSWGRYMGMVKRLFGQMPALSPTFLTPHDQQERNQILWQAIHKLPATHQELIYLRYFLNFSELEMAETVGIPIGTVKSRLHRALDRLRQIIETQFPELKS